MTLSPALCAHLSALLVGPRFFHLAANGIEEYPNLAFVTVQNEHLSISRNVEVFHSFRASSILSIPPENSSSRRFFIARFTSSISARLRTEITTCENVKPSSFT